MPADNTCFCYETNVENLVTLDCGHQFHKACLLEWYKTTCTYICCYCTKKLPDSDLFKLITTPELKCTTKFSKVEKICKTYIKMNDSLISELKNASSVIEKNLLIQSILIHQCTAKENLNWATRYSKYKDTFKFNDVAEYYSKTHQYILIELLTNSEYIKKEYTLKWCVLFGYSKLVQLCIRCDRTNIKKCLKECISCGNLDLVKWIHENYKSITNLNLILDIAVRNDQLEIIEYCLKAGADVHYNEDFSIIASSCEGDTKITRLLLEYGADPNIENYPLMAFVSNGCIPGVKLLLDYGAVLNNPEYDLLEIACERSLEMMKFLLDRGIDITPDSIKSAIDSGSVSRVKMLFDYNPDLVIGEPDLIVAVSKILEKTE